MAFRRHILTRIGNFLRDAAAWGRTKGILNVVKQHGSAILALSGVVIPVCSLYLTIQSQKEDHFYKMLSIRPALGYVVRTVDLSVSLINDGSGPAEIKEAVYSVEGKCLQLYKADITDHEKG
jgi:hypothetical protein